MINNEVYLIKGWKIDDSEIADALIDQLCEVDEDFYDDCEGEYFVTDCMAGEYIYFGAIIGSIDADSDYPDDIEVDEQVIKEKFDNWNKMLLEKPEVARVFKQYMEGPAKTYVLYHVY
jgi:hypothetical protein